MSRIPWNTLLQVTLGGAAALLLLAMMTVTTVDVLGRYLLNSPLSGAFEMTELMLAALIFLGLPLATERGEHITVDLMDPVLPHQVINSQVVVMNWLSAVVMAVLARQLWVKAGGLVEDGHVTNTLEVPLAPVGYLMALSCALAALILLVKGVLVARDLFNTPNDRAD